MSQVDTDGIELAVTRLLRAAGQDVTREGLRDTPARYARFIETWLDQPPPKMTSFAVEGDDGGMIVQTDIPFFSLCEHHMLPFHGTAIVGYVPEGRMLGLSKLARAVRYCSRGFQNQERITSAVADMVSAACAPRGVGVLIRAEHLCMSMRGVQAAGAMTTTSALRGCFMADERCRAEFMAIAKRGQSGT